MKRIVLINMPNAALDAPSLALTQLSGVIHKRFPTQCRVETLYLNHDFAAYMARNAAAGAPDLYNDYLSAFHATHTGLGDWFFRQAAFPELPDNSVEYFRRYYPQQSGPIRVVKHLLLEKRKGLDSFLDSLIDQYELETAWVVGLTSMFSQTVASVALARKLKSRTSTVLTVMGGANCEAPMGQQLARHLGCMDFIFSGPALQSFGEFIQCLLDGRREACEKIRGVFQEHSDDALSKQSIGDELDVDNEIPLDYSAFLNAFRRTFPGGERKPRLYFETSRGCWWGERAHCTFCGLNGMTMAYRAMSPEKALRQFRSLFEQYGQDCSYFESVDNIMPRSYLSDVFPYLTPPEGTTVFYEVKADLTDAELRVLAAAGVREVQPGIEALATSTLQLMKKGTTAFVNLIFLKNCVRYWIRPIWNLLLGFPGETSDVYQKYVKDIPLLVHLFPPSGVHPVRFDRYSPYFVKAAEYGLALRPYDYYGLIYPFDAKTLRNMAYFFLDDNYTSNYLASMVEWINPLRESVDGWQRAWQKGEAPELRLSRSGGAWVLHDSRFGPGRDIVLDMHEAGMLQFLNRARRSSDLERYAASSSGWGLDEALRFLQDRKLVIVEGERLVSLVVCDDDARVEEQSTLEAVDRQEHESLNLVSLG
jgi:ribosomal peptide maturation radical SAM protein 1